MGVAMVARNLCWGLTTEAPIEIETPKVEGKGMGRG